jgi:16S rRNA (cytidine1402-2'-O)-methyltransferase
LNEGTLFVVATPIGNLGDLSPRAKDVLDAADLIAAEDTRVTGRLLSHFGINCPQISLHEHNEARQIGKVMHTLENGGSVALVSDAGTPLISDPGFRLIEAAHAAGVTVSPIPGASAALAALCAAGLPTDHFVFEGFLPARQARRLRRLDTLAREASTIVFYEAVHRIRATIDDLVTRFGSGRPAFVGRELTKLHEQCVRADLGTIAAMLADGRIPEKGEFVIVVGGIGDSDDSNAAQDADRLLAILAESLPGKQAVKLASRITGLGRNELYDKMLSLRSGEKRDKS